MTEESLVRPGNKEAKELSRRLWARVNPGYIEYDDLKLSSQQAAARDFDENRDQLEPVDKLWHHKRDTFSEYTEAKIKSGFNRFEKKREPVKAKPATEKKPVPPK